MKLQKCPEQNCVPRKSLLVPIGIACGTAVGILLVIIAAMVVPEGTEDKIQIFAVILASPLIIGLVVGLIREAFWCRHCLGFRSLITFLPLGIRRVKLLERKPAVNLNKPRVGIEFIV